MHENHLIHIIGELTLNLSFALYIIFYLPQLIHNLHRKKTNELSFAFHAMLMIAATADLYYGFGRIQQWQYRAVSVLMFACLLAQHIHLYFTRQEKWQLNLLSLTILIMLIGLFITFNDKHINPMIFIIMGWVERSCYWFYAVPQIFKNRHLRSAASISPWFIGIGLITGICDTTSAWIFNWGSPSLYGTPIAIALHLWLFWQCFKLRVKKHGNFELANYS